MKTLSGKAFCRVLERHGWELLRIQGSHHVYGKAGQRARISVPVHGSRPLKLGLQRHLLKLAGMPEDVVLAFNFLGDGLRDAADSNT